MLPSLPATTIKIRGPIAWATFSKSLWQYCLKSYFSAISTHFLESGIQTSALFPPCTFTNVPIHPSHISSLIPSYALQNRPLSLSIFSCNKSFMKKYHGFFTWKPSLFRLSKHWLTVGLQEFWLFPSSVHPHRETKLSTSRTLSAMARIRTMVAASAHSPHFSAFSKHPQVHRPRRIHYGTTQLISQPYTFSRYLDCVSQQTMRLGPQHSPRRGASQTWNEW